MQHEFEIEVRYYETDGQGIVHHSNYFQYFELARVKMLQAAGYNYEDLERDGHFLVVHSIRCRYLLPARFGDTLRLVTTMERATPARIDHRYSVFRDDDLLAEGSSTIACVDRQGAVQRMPDVLLQKHS
ncbi:MAG: acyl-CoA thioesterase [Pirellulales bacterium]|nr:acyl-CoA thioesterase [Pirellulales bacterium]